MLRHPSSARRIWRELRSLASSDLRRRTMLRRMDYGPPQPRNVDDRPLAQSMDELVADLVPTIVERAEGRYGLFGHSMGASVALAATARLSEIVGAPALMVVSTARWPLTNTRRRTTGPETLRGETLVRRLRDLGAIREDIRVHPAVLLRLLPVIEADLEILRTW